MRVSSAEVHIGNPQKLGEIVAIQQPSITMRTHHLTMWTAAFGTLVLAARCVSAANLEDCRPQWRPGLRFIVACESQASGKGSKSRWQFHVTDREQFQSRSCFKAHVRCLGAPAHPGISIWLDEQSMTLRRVRTELRSAKGSVVLDESYSSASGQPFAVMPPVTIPPLEVPYLADGAKGDQSFVYDVGGPPQEAKAVGIRFRCPLVQRGFAIEPRRVRDLLPTDFRKSAGDHPAFEVRMSMATARSYQLWQPGAPWPVYSENGVARSQLISVDAGDERVNTRPAADKSDRNLP